MLSSSPIHLTALPPALFFYLKIAFVLFLFIINLYFIFIHEKESMPKKELQSGFNIKNFRGILTSLATVGGLLSAAITMKNEIRDIKIGRLDQLMEAERENIRRSIDKDREEHQKILDALNSNREELFKLHTEKAKIFAHNDRLLNLHNSIKDSVNSYIVKSAEPSTKLSELGILDQTIKQDTKKMVQEIDSVFFFSEGLLEEGSDNNPQIESSKIGETNIEDNLKDLKESRAFDFSIFTNLWANIDWFEGLNGIKKLAVSLILGKSVIFSALISIIFIFYGNILIEKYDLINKYPKLAKFIQLRQKFQKYYFNFYCGLIFTIILADTAFALAVLFWL